MKPRTLKVLYNIVYEIAQKRLAKNYWVFICHIIQDLLDKDTITQEEFNLLHNHFFEQYPTNEQYEEFYYARSFMHQSWKDKKSLEDSSWFIQSDRNIRVLFLEAILEKLA